MRTILGLLLGVCLAGCAIGPKPEDPTLTGDLDSGSVADTASAIDAPVTTPDGGSPADTGTGGVDARDPDGGSDGAGGDGPGADSDAPDALDADGATDGAGASDAGGG